LNLVKVKYDHPAYPPEGINLGVVYEVDVTKDKVNIDGVEFKLELVKTLFTPIDKKWEDNEVKKEVNKRLNNE